MANIEDFNIVFELTIGHEGGYSNDPDDSGNWTSGQIGIGELNGTKYGISAAAYPGVDIENITLNQAKAIYFADYWIPAGCEKCQPRLAYVMFDAAVNNGVSRAVTWLQGAIGTFEDGSFGPNTAEALAAASAVDLYDVDLASEVHAQRIYFMADLTTWDDFGLGWSRRLARVPLQATHYWPEPPSPPLAEAAV